MKHRPATRSSAIPPDYPTDPKEMQKAVLRWQKEMKVGRTYKGNHDDFAKR